MLDRDLGNINLHFEGFVPQVTTSRISAADLQALGEIQYERDLLRARSFRAKSLLPFGVAIAGIAAIACSEQTDTTNTHVSVLETKVSVQATQIARLESGSLQAEPTPVSEFKVQCQGDAGLVGSACGDSWLLFAATGLVAVGVAFAATLKFAKR